MMHHYRRHFRTTGSAPVTAGVGEVRLPQPPANLDWRLKLISAGIDIATTGTVAIYVNGTQGQDCIGYITPAAGAPGFVVEPKLELVVDDTDTIIVRGTGLGAATRIDAQVWYELMNPGDIPADVMLSKFPGLVNPQLPHDTTVAKLAPDLFLDVA